MLLLKHPLFLLFETMLIIAQTPQGIVRSVEEPYDEEKYQRRMKVLEAIDTLDSYWFTTDVGQCYMSKAMIDQSIFFLVK
jgi:hypothetical protein